MYKHRTSSKDPDYHGAKAIYDVAIIGGGPAGLSAAIWLARFLHTVIVFDSGDPRNWQTRDIHGFLGHLNIRPAELRKLSRQQCLQYGVSVIDARVESAQPYPHSIYFQVINADLQEILARRILISIGMLDHWPQIPGLERCYGSTIHTCPFCDGYEARNSRIAVIGAGHKAASTAITLRTWSPSVIICTHGQSVAMPPDLLRKLNELKIAILTKPIEFLQARLRNLHHITFSQGDEIPCDHIFIALGQYSPDGPTNTLGCKLDDNDRLLVDSSFRTTVPGVFAAGDITPGLQLAMRAASQGIDAAVAIHRSLSTHS